MSGRELMTEQERTEFHSRLQGAASDEERQQIRWEHHMRMQERAKERGVTLPDEPPMFGMHQQPRRGSGGQGRLRTGGAVVVDAAAEPRNFVTLGDDEPRTLLDRDELNLPEAN